MLVVPQAELSATARPFRGIFCTFRGQRTARRRSFFAYGVSAFNPMTTGRSLVYCSQGLSLLPKSVPRPAARARSFFCRVWRTRWGARGWRTARLAPATGGGPPMDRVHAPLLWRPGGYAAEGMQRAPASAARCRRPRDQVTADPPGLPPLNGYTTSLTGHA